jgi:hypothetical protein
MPEFSPTTTANQHDFESFVFQNSFQKSIIRQSSTMLMLGGMLAVLFGFKWGVGVIVNGLGGLYRIQKQQAGWLGFIGFVVSLISSAVLFGLQIVNILLANLTKAPANVFQILPPTQSTGIMAVIYWVGGLASYGYIIWGMGMLRGGVMPHSSVILLIIGSILLAFNPQLSNLGGIIVGIAFAWIGFHERQISKALTKRSY